MTADESPLPYDVVATPILTEPLLLIVPASYRRNPESVKDLCGDLDMIRVGRDPFSVSRIDHRLYELGAPLRRRYQSDTGEAALQMAAAGLGWTLLSVLAVFGAIGRDERIRALPFPGEAMRRTVMVVARSGVGAHVAERIRDAAVEALRTEQPGVRRSAVLQQLAVDVGPFPRVLQVETTACQARKSSSGMAQRG